MSRLAEPIEVLVTFSLPDWFPPERCYTERGIYYPAGHAWEGSFDTIEGRNSAEDSIMKLSGVDEACFHPMGPWIRFKVPIRNFHRHVERIQAKLTRYLSRFKEARLAAAEVP